MAASIIVILARLIGISLDSSQSFGVFKLNNAPTNLVPFVAEILCIYYFVHFFIVFVSEAQNFRSEKQGLQSLSTLSADLNATAATLCEKLKDLLGATESVSLKLDEYKTRQQSINEPVRIQPASSYQTVHDETFNAISGAIRFTAGSNVARGLPETELRKHLNWAELSREIERRIVALYHDGGIARAVNDQVAKRAAAVKSFGELQAQHSDLAIAINMLANECQKTSSRYNLISSVIGFYRGAWWVRIWIFDLAMPLVVFIASQLLLIPDPGWMNGFKHFIGLA